MREANNPIKPELNDLLSAALEGTGFEQCDFRLTETHATSAR